MDDMEDPGIVVSSKCDHPEKVMDTFYSIYLTLMEARLTLSDAKAIVHMLAQFLAGIAEGVTFEDIMCELMEIHREGKIKVENNDGITYHLDLWHQPSRKECGDPLSSEKNRVCDQLSPESTLICGGKFVPYSLSKYLH